MIIVNDTIGFRSRRCVNDWKTGFEKRQSNRKKIADYSAKDIVAVALNIGNYTRMKMYQVYIADNEASTKQ